MLILYEITERKNDNFGQSFIRGFCIYIYFYYSQKSDWFFLLFKIVYYVVQLRLNLAGGGVIVSGIVGVMNEETINFNQAFDVFWA